MAIKEVVLERIPSQDSVLYINKSGISFSASFIKKEKLEAAEGVKFFVFLANTILSTLRYDTHNVTAQGNNDNEKKIFVQTSAWYSKK